MHSYSRTTGKKLTYQIEVSGTNYFIRLNGKVLKESIDPMVCKGVVRDAAVVEWAIRDIEELDGMAEE